MRDFRSDCYNNNQPRREVARQSGSTITQMVNAVFREPIHQVLEKIKNESFFKWSNKMGGDPMKRNQSLHCQYHQDRGHTTKDCRTLRSHLEQLVREGRQFLHQPNGPRGLTGSGFQGNAFSRALLGTINVIFTA